VVGLVRGYGSPSTARQWILGRKSGKASCRRWYTPSLSGVESGLRCVVDEVIGKQFFEQRALVLPRTTVGITEASAGHHRQTMTELTTNRASAAGPSSVDRSPSTASQLDRPVAPGLNRAETPADSCYRRTC
jgi:hypothetical protein